MLETHSVDESLLLPSSRLESLRGLAAIQVAAYHSLSAMEACQCNQDFIAPAMVLFNGQSAVSLFFVLSGFVLGLSLRRSKGSFGQIYLRYAIRRFFRIYPTIIISTVIVAIFIAVWKTPPLTKSLFINQWMPGKVTASLFAQQLLLIRFFNPVTWTLRMELVCSLLLPLALAVERWRPKLLPIILAFLIVLAFLLPTTISVVVTPAFFLGYLLPSTFIFWHWMKRHWILNVSLLLVGMVALLVPRSLNLSRPAIIIWETAGAVTIVGTIFYGAELGIFKILDHHFIKAAGRVSYSYYVYQPMCLVGAGRLIIPLVSVPFLMAYPLPVAILLWIASSIVAFPLAWIGYRYVEKPFINCAKPFYTVKTTTTRV